MSEFTRITGLLNALRAVTDHLSGVENSATGAAHPGLDQLAAEVRDAIKAVADQTAALLSELTGPIWGELPPGLREQCCGALREREQDDG